MTLRDTLRASFLLLALWCGGSLAAAQSGDADADAEPASSLATQGDEDSLDERAAEVSEEATEAENIQILGESAALDARLRSTLSAAAVFEGVEVESTKAGIVVLGGTAGSRGAAEAAVDLVESMDGVVLVVDQIEVDLSLPRRLEDAWRRALEQLRDAGSYAPLLVIAALIVALALLLARWVSALELPFRWFSDRALLQNLLRQTVVVAIVLAGVIAALQFLDAGRVIGTVLGAAGVVGLALGFAFRDIVENYLSGILLAIRQPFRARDSVCVDDVLGTVVRMTASETTLLDPDGNHVRIPNSAVFKGRVTNYTRNPLRRFTVSLGVGVNEDLVAAQELGIATLDRMKGVVDDPAPSSRVTALGDSDVRLEFYGWVDQQHTSFVKVASEAVRLVKTTLDDAGVDMPMPAYRVELEGGAVEPAIPRAETPRPEPPTRKVVAPEEIDVSVEDDLLKQVEQDIAASDEPDLLTDGSEGSG